MKRSRKIILFGGAIVLLALVVALVARYSKPEGMFDDPQIGSLFFAYWEFKDGKVWLVTPDSRSFEGSYYRKDERWLYQTKTAKDSYLYLESSILGFQLVDSNRHVTLPTRRRIFLRPTVPKEEPGERKLF